MTLRKKRQAVRVGPAPVVCAGSTTWNYALTTKGRDMLKRGAR